MSSVNNPSLTSHFPSCSHPCFHHPHHSLHEDVTLPHHHVPHLSLPLLEDAHSSLPSFKLIYFLISTAPEVTEGANPRWPLWPHFGRRKVPCSGHGPGGVGGGEGGAGRAVPSPVTSPPSSHDPSWSVQSHKWRCKLFWHKGMCVCLLYLLLQVMIVWWRGNEGQPNTTRVLVIILPCLVKHYRPWMP